MIVRTCVASLLASCIATVAPAGIIAVSDIGGGILLNSGPLVPGLFGNSETAWSTSALASVHAHLNSNGIATDGKITILAAETDYGISLMALIDAEIGESSTAALGHLHLDTVANGNNLAFANDAGGLITISPASSNARIASGSLEWNSNGGGDAFAWAGLLPGNSMTFRFNRTGIAQLGLNEPATFQFINWNGAAWGVVALPVGLQGFTSTGDYGFAASVLVPAPSALMMCAAPLPLLLRRRRAI
jgi:hypothetical protein